MKITFPKDHFLSDKHLKKLRIATHALQHVQFNCPHEVHAWVRTEGTSFDLIREFNEFRIRVLNMNSYFQVVRETLFPLFPEYSILIYHYRCGECHVVSKMKWKENSK